MVDTTIQSAVATSRPRIEGEREAVILDAALGLLVDSGYDKLTMDAVAAAAHASKATLYRRWVSKADLVVDALCRAKQAPQVEAPDTGSLRDDLVRMACASGGISDEHAIGVMASVITAIHRDPEFADAFYERVIAPKVDESRIVFARAQERGDIRPDAELDLLAHVLPALILHRAFVLQLPVDEDVVVRYIDEIVLPAAMAPASGRPLTPPPPPSSPEASASSPDSTADTQAAPETSAAAARPRPSIPEGA